LIELSVCYHAISSRWEHRLALPKELLLRQVRTLRRVAPVHVTFDDAFASVVSVLPDLAAMDCRVTVFVCTGFADRGGAALLVPELATDARPDLEGLRTLGWRELRAIAESGVDIGSHTVDHPHLPSLDDGALRRQLIGSKRRIEAELDRRCSSLAYPYGEHDKRVRAAVQDAGYDRAYALRARRQDPFAMPRVDLYRRHTPARALIRSCAYLVPAPSRR
jgi:peptidoglycan/xylan/chitin deacetylase (PgdA/CDA1 family)